MTSLRRLWKSLSLSSNMSRLNVNVKISPNLTHPPLVHVTFNPGWQESGSVDISQQLSTTCREITVEVCDKGENVTVSLPDDATQPRSTDTLTDLTPNTALGFANYTEVDLEDLWPPFPYTSSSSSFSQSSDPPCPLPALYLKFSVPSKLHLSAHLSAGSITQTSDKIEGNTTLTTLAGDITVAKLRGHNISLSATGGNVTATKLIEAETANLTATHGRVLCKMVNGHAITITSITPPTNPALVAEDDTGAAVDIASLYTNDRSKPATVTVDGGSLRIKNSHGSVVASVVAPPTWSANLDSFGVPIPVVELGGVSGECVVSVTTPNPPSTEFIAARVHVDTAFGDSWSEVVADRGDVCLTVDRKLQGDVRMLSCEGEVAGQVQYLNGEIDELNGEVEEGRGERIVFRNERARESMDVGKSVVCADGAEYLEGRISNVSKEPDSRFEAKNRGGGKINFDEAGDQALKGFEGAGEIDEGVEPMIIVGTGHGGVVSLETLEWMEQIKRRYGVEDIEFGKNDHLQQ